MDMKLKYTAILPAVGHRTQRLQGGAGQKRSYLEDCGKKSRKWNKEQ